MTNEKVFTIGVPVYNGMPYLPETIESIFAQSRGDFELLVINDGSTDGTRQYLETLHDARLRVVHQENCGLTRTLNRMLHEVKTPWLVRMDADDLARPNRIEVLHGAVQQSPNAAIFYTDASHFGHPSAVSSARITVGSPTELSEIVRAGYLLSIIHSTVALNVRKTRVLGGYRFDLHVEDLDLWSRMALHHDIVYIPEVTVDYRLNNASICRNNLRKLTLNTLYVQYILLSRLWRLPPFSYDDVAPLLEGLVDEDRLRYRERMWNAAIHLSRHEYLSAAVNAAGAIVASPLRVAERLSHAFRPPKVFRLGIDPTRFWNLRRELWRLPLAELANAECGAL